MQKQRRIGITAFIVLISVVSLSFVYSNISFFMEMFSDFLNQLFLMFLYALIPCVPAVVLRAKFGLRALKWIALAATILGGLCCLIHIILPETALDQGSLEYVGVPETVLEEYKIFYPDTILDDVEIVSPNYGCVFIFTQYALISSVSALYCIAFIGQGRAILVALAPSLMFFLSLLIRYIMISGLFTAFEFILDQSVLLLMLASVGYSVWAVVLIFISHIVYMFINRLKAKNDFV